MRVRLRVTDHVQRVECCALVEQLEGLVRFRVRVRVRVRVRLRVRVEQLEDQHGRAHVDDVADAEEGLVRVRVRVKVRARARARARPSSEAHVRRREQHTQRVRVRPAVVEHL